MSFWRALALFSGLSVLMPLITDICLPAIPDIAKYYDAKNISEDAVMKTKFALDVKTMISAAVGIASLVGMWYALQADIEEAKSLPSLESLYAEEYPSKPEGYNWPRSYEQYKDNVEGLQDEMDDAYGRIEELEELIKELQQDIKSLERRKRDK